MEKYTVFLWIMSITALIVFFALYHVKAGYGKFAAPKWGYAINSRSGWVIMETPALFVMLFLYIYTPRDIGIVPLVFFLFFELHYFQRSIVFPLLIRGKNTMPLSIIFMGIFFNILNGLMQGLWIFFLHPEGQYTTEWFFSPFFIAGTILFFAGMIINIHSDSVIRNLRQPGDTRHYLPGKGLYKYVTSANYFGEVIEWTGFALLTFSWPALVFAWWTFANLVPRADAIYRHYIEEFGETAAQRMRIFPFVY